MVTRSSSTEQSGTRGRNPTTSRRANLARQKAIRSSDTAKPSLTALSRGGSRPYALSFASGAAGSRPSRQFAGRDPRLQAGTGTMSRSPTGLSSTLRKYRAVLVVLSLQPSSSGFRSYLTARPAGSGRPLAPFSFLLRSEPNSRRGCEPGKGPISPSTVWC